MGYVQNTLFYLLTLTFGYTTIDTWYGMTFFVIGIIGIIVKFALLVIALYIVFNNSSKNKKDFEKMLKKLNVR